MFQWLKRALNNLLPSDIDKGMMSCNFCTIKIGDKIKIPENCVCLVTYKDKTYNTLQPGSYTLSKELLIDLYQKQLKNEKELKKLKVDFFFVNTKDFSYNFDYIDKIPICGKLKKLIFNVNINLNVSNCQVFASNVLSEFSSVNALSCERLILDYIENLIRNFFLHKELEDYSIPENMQSELKDKLANQLEKIGISLNLFKISISCNKKETTIQSFSESANNFSQETDISKIEHDKQNTIDQNQNLYYNEQNNTKKNSTHCHNCGCKIIKGSLYCHRCGKPLN